MSSIWWLRADDDDDTLTTNILSTYLQKCLRPNAYYYIWPAPGSLERNLFAYPRLPKLESFRYQYLLTYYLIKPHLTWQDGFGEENPEQALQDLLANRTVEEMLGHTAASAHLSDLLALDTTDKSIQNKSRLAPNEPLMMERISEHDMTLFRKCEFIYESWKKAY